MDLAPATRAEGLRRLTDFLPRAGRDYARLRNHDLGPGRHEHVSGLSPYIRHRLVLEEEAASAVLARHSFSAAEKFIQEVFWRTYWKGWLERRPGVWTAYRGEVLRLAEALGEDSDLRTRWEEATAGRTGIACFDAWARELIETGYLHNHARMWFASAWIFTLELPWALGADFFLRHLLDGDPASNTLSWRWVAGLQTKGKTYLARPDNIAKYTDGRFPPVRGLAPTAPPLDGPPHPEAGAPPDPLPWDPSLPSGLLVTEEDMAPETLLGSGGPFLGCATLNATRGRSPLPVSERVLSFVDEGLADVRARSDAAWADQGEAAEPDLDGLVEWARGLGLRQVVTPYAPVGPTAETLDRLSEKLAADGIGLVQVLRNWDRQAWPHASRGFFPFRAKIPAILGRVRAAADQPERRSA